MGKGIARLCESVSRKTCFIVNEHIIYSTWRNAQLGESVIQQLEDKSQQMAAEKQETIGNNN